MVILESGVFQMLLKCFDRGFNDLMDGIVVFSGFQWLPEWFW